MLKTILIEVLKTGFFLNLSPKYKDLKCQNKRNSPQNLFLPSYFEQTDLDQTEWSRELTIFE